MQYQVSQATWSEADPVGARFFEIRGIQTRGQFGKSA